MSEIEVNPSVEDEEISGEMEEDFQEHQKNNGADTESPVILWSDHPISVPQMVHISRWLTKKYNRPIAVIPRTGNVNVMGFTHNSYCKFKATTLAEYESAKAKIELYKTYYWWSVDEITRERVKHYDISFLSEPEVKKATHEAFKSFEFDRYIYNAITENDEKFILLSDKKLELGQEYSVIGSVFSTRQMDTSSMRLGRKQMLCFSCMVIEEDEKINYPLIEKCKGRDMSWFITSVAYPFDNSLVEYSELITVNTFHLQTGFPFNLVLIGGADRTKTAFLTKMSAITKSLVYETGASTVKGLLPSFYRDNMDAGILASSGCKYKALVNEFFEIISKVKRAERASYLNSLKSTLEGRLTPFISGTGKMTVKQKGDLLAASNFPQKQAGYHFRSVYEIYEDYDPAFMDRILFYTVPRDQEKMVMDHKDRVKDLMMKTGKTDDVEAISVLDYGNLLTPIEIRQLMALAKRCKPRITDVEHKKRMSKSFIEQLPSERFTRHSEFVTNIASAYAFLRHLQDGSLLQELELTNSPMIQISTEDVDRAANFLWVIINTYQNVESELSERAVKIRMLTAKEKELYGILLETYKKHKDNPYQKKLKLDDVFRIIENNLSVVDMLLEKELAISDGVNIMYMPELSIEANEAWGILKTGGQPRRDFGYYLCKLGLALKHEDEYSNAYFESSWVRKQGLGVVL